MTPLPKFFQQRLYPLWGITLCLLNNNTTNIRVDINHAITDGRVIFDYLELFSCISNGEEIPEKYTSREGQDPLDIHEFLEKMLLKHIKFQNHGINKNLLN